MQRLKDEFLERVDRLVPLAGMQVLEVGCGEGKRTADLARRCQSVIGIDPDPTALKVAEKRKIPNATFKVESGESITLDETTVDVVFFTMSFHHVPVDRMNDALAEAVRVLRPTGSIVFCEIGEPGTEDQAEALFSTEGKCDSTAAVKAILSSSRLNIVSDEQYETIFQYESAQDFITDLKPTRNLDRLDDFLKDHNYRLVGNRRIIIAQPATGV